MPPICRRIHILSSAHGTFLRIDHILGHKSNLSKFKKIEIISSIVSDHNAMRLDTNYRKRIVKKHKQWRLTNTFLNNQQVTEEIKREIKEFLEINESENMTTMGCNRSSSKKKVYSNKKAYLRKQEKINNLTLNLKELEKEQTKFKVSRRKEIIKMRAEIHEIDTKNNRKDQ